MSYGFTRAQLELIAEDSSSGAHQAMLIHRFVAGDDVSSMKAARAAGWHRSAPVISRSGEDSVKALSPLRWIASPDRERRAIASVWAKAAGLSTPRKTASLALYVLVSTAARYWASDSVQSELRTSELEGLPAQVTGLMAAGADAFTPVWNNKSAFWAATARAASSRSGGMPWAETLLAMVKGSADVFGSPERMLDMFTTDSAEKRSWMATSNGLAPFFRLWGAWSQSADAPRAEIERTILNYNFERAIADDPTSFRAFHYLYPCAVAPGNPKVSARLWKSRPSDLGCRTAAVIGPAISPFSIRERERLLGSRDRWSLAMWLLACDAARSQTNVDASFVLEVIRGWCTQARAGGADLDAPIVPTGHSALHISAGFSRIELVQALLEAGASPSARGGLDETPAEYARAHDRHEIADMLERAANREALLRISATVSERRARMTTGRAP